MTKFAALTASTWSSLALAVFLAAPGGCKKKPEAGRAGSVETTSASASVPMPAPSQPVAAATDRLLGSSVAAFDGDRLVACLDVAMTPEPFERLMAMAQSAGKLDAGSDAQFLLDDDVRGYLNAQDTMIGSVLNDVYGKGTASALRPRGKPTPIGKPCRQQFSSRTVIASCAVSARLQHDAGFDWRLGAEFLYFDALAGDGAMKGCLGAKGNWEELPKDSAAFLHEKHDQLFRRLINDSSSKQ